MAKALFCIITFIAKRGEVLVYIMLLIGCQKTLIKIIIPLVPNYLAKTD